MKEYRVQKRLEMRKVFDLFENFRTAVAVRDAKALDYPVKIPSKSVVLTEQGVETKEEGIMTFWNYLELLRNSELKKVAEGHSIMLKTGADIVQLAEQEYGDFLARMSRLRQELDWVAVCYRARGILRRLKNDYPDIMKVR